MPTQTAAPLAARASGRGLRRVSHDDVGRTPPREVADREVDCPSHPVASAHQQHDVQPRPAQPSHATRPRSFTPNGSRMMASLRRSSRRCRGRGRRPLGRFPRQQAPDLHPGAPPAVDGGMGQLAAAAHRGRGQVADSEDLRVALHPEVGPDPEPPAAPRAAPRRHRVVDLRHRSPRSSTRTTPARRRKAPHSRGALPHGNITAAPLLARAALQPLLAQLRVNGASTSSVISTSTTRTRSGPPRPAGEHHRRGVRRAVRAVGHRRGVDDAEAVHTRTCIVGVEQEAVVRAQPAHRCRWIPVSTVRVAQSTICWSLPTIGPG